MPSFPWEYVTDSQCPNARGSAMAQVSTTYLRLSVCLASARKWARTRLVAWRFTISVQRRRCGVLYTYGPLQISAAVIYKCPTCMRGVIGQLFVCVYEGRPVTIEAATGYRTLFAGSDFGAWYLNVISIVDSQQHRHLVRISSLRGQLKISQLFSRSLIEQLTAETAFTWLLCHWFRHILCFLAGVEILHSIERRHPALPGSCTLEFFLERCHVQQIVKRPAEDK